jgi:hypothetical protein
VVRTDPGKPRFLELVATFYDASHARDYADGENSRAAEPAGEPTASTAAPEQHVVERTEVTAELSPRQSAVLGTLRAKMNGSHLVEEKAAVLAEAAHIPLGSLHSVLQSLEKKQLIRTARAGSGRAPAVYQVL